MMQHHKYSLTELENMLPYEREIYIALLEEYLVLIQNKLNEIKQRQKIFLEDLSRYVSPAVTSTMQTRTRAAANERQSGGASMSANDENNYEALRNQLINQNFLI